MKRAALILISACQLVSLSAFGSLDSASAIRVDANGNVTNATDTNFSHTGHKLKVDNVEVLGGGGTPAWSSITGIPSALNTLSEQQTDALQYLVALGDRTVALTKFTFTAGALSGKTGYAPGAGYAASEYMRDFAMTVRSRPELFPPAEILDHIALFYAARGGAGQIWDSVDINGAAQTAGGFTPGSGEPPAAIDNQYEWIDLIYSHYLKTGTTTAYHIYAANSGIANALAYPTISNNLVNIASNSNHLLVQIGFGFQDQVVSTGYELMTSVMRYRALNQLSLMAAADGDSTTAATYASSAAAVQSNLRTQLWDSSANLFKNASGTNTQHSVPGSAYAVVINNIFPGLLLSGDVTSITTKLRAGLRGNADDLAGKGFVGAGSDAGEIRHLPLNENWTSVDRFGSAPGAGTYQNGAYWATFTGWVAQALNIGGYAHDGDMLLSSLITKMRADPITSAPIEASNSAASYNGSARYTISALLPTETYRGRAIPFFRPSLYEGMISYIDYSSGNVDLVLQPRGNGESIFGGGGWAYNTQASGAGSVLLNNGTNDTPNVKFAYAANHNFGMDSALDFGNQKLRFIVDADESGGFVAGTMDLVGNFYMKSFTATNGNFNSSAGFGLTDPSVTNAIITPNDGVAGAKVYAGAGGQVLFGAGTTEYGRFNGSGNFAPQQNLLILAGKGVTAAASGSILTPDDGVLGAKFFAGSGGAITFGNGASEKMRLFPAGGLNLGGTGDPGAGIAQVRGLRSNAVTFANAIASPVEGTLQAFTDSSTATWGATITGGGSNHVLGYFDGTNWTVAGK